MLRHASATPCPIPDWQLNLSRHNSIPSAADDNTTANIEFTTAFGGSLRNIKPRRRPTAVKKKNNALDFPIHEDADPQEIGDGKQTVLAQPARRKAVSQPSQRQRRRVSFGASDEIRSQAPLVEPCPSHRLSQAPRRPIIKTEGQSEPLPPLPEDTDLTMSSTTILRPARRGTIYIPNDDTTMPSMYMGIFSPIKDLDARLASEAAEARLEVTGIAAQMVKKQGPRRSVIAVSPKRGPLQVVGRHVQETAIVEDRLGQGPGKENLPPGYCTAVDQKPGKHTSIAKRGSMNLRVCDPIKPQIDREARSSKLCEPTARLMGRIIDSKTTPGSGGKHNWNSGACVRIDRPLSAKKISSKPGPMVEVNEPPLSRKPSVPSRFVIPNIKAEPVVEAYPILREDLATPFMYEDSWLSHQEIAITQLVNGLFDASTPPSPPAEGGILTIRLLERYGNAENVLLYKRIQATLLYGSLSISAEVLKAAGSLGNDVGKRKVFTDLWLETYDPSCLRSALEVVVGRQCVSAAGSPSTRPSIDKGASTSRRALQQFIETFLIRNKDGTPDHTCTDRIAWSYRRTMLRSLMLIKLLDLSKAPSGQLVSQCLFQASSTYKSSVSVVKALFQLLNPGAGDPVRALSHIGYNVTHSQFPLEEYEYKIENLAVDLRDGVRLTRLVELLLYPSASQFLERRSDPDSTTTVLLPTGELLSLSDGQRDWPLSQHLKFPCLGRATKLYNVEIALSALRSVKGMTALVHDVKAEDLVDGFREKTVKLLWGLTSKWGLGSLVDWDDVEREIKRICRTVSNFDNDYFEALGDDEHPARYQVLLKSWAQAIAQKGGFMVRNLTTSFADGQVFAAIVDEYERYFAPDAQVRKGRQLSDRLRSLGCSEQFSGLFSGSDPSARRTHILDRDFVLAALAFLCSRLLGPSKRVRAAVTIQKAWRSYQGRALDSRRVRLKMLAEACANAARGRGKDLNGTQLVREVCESSNRDEDEFGYDGQERPWLEETEEDIWLSL
ncbi:uncharacterized protein Z518_07696 [Rhinocladiella mackenziei CBS 650.93]|uniref:Rhinocladiella mackenziei CBS 650.93 unplaced genomic scaffold supercont1.5, whole genome shotgun sequence n=1 Tax=Rhinocladiella mackenziei CBS 650.93 TaxID=1442369 RepID=A0A0D2FPL6_9EURO|nr:uncharacterized protein Z518_07696 [Rhinocladiella mackenziei CBS 650.93]KIX04142.1 hypothetical protein Z518_07696 [Rhinocladiella mackenziei CBS 650.93]